VLAKTKLQAAGMPGYPARYLGLAFIDIHVRLCMQVCTYPLALAKTKLQAAGMPGYPARYLGLADCLRQTVKEGGLRGLYHGILPNLLKAVPAISISYVVFE